MGTLQVDVVAMRGRCVGSPLVALAPVAPPWPCASPATPLSTCAGDRGHGMNRARVTGRATWVSRIPRHYLYLSISDKQAWLLLDSRVVD